MSTCRCNGTTVTCNNSSQSIICNPSTSSGTIDSDLYKINAMEIFILPWLPGAMQNTDKLIQEVSANIPGTNWLSDLRLSKDFIYHSLPPLSKKTESPSL